MIDFIDENREEYGVEPLCKSLPIAPSTYHLKIVGGPAQLLSEDAVTAIHQGSGGLLRRANALAGNGKYF